MIKYEKNYLYLPHKTLELPSKIKKVIFLQDIYLILLEKCTQGKKYTQNSNLCAYDTNGDRLWVAELPTTNPGDNYYEIEKNNEKIAAYSNWDYYCLISPQNGKIIEKIFTK